MASEHENQQGDIARLLLEREVRDFLYREASFLDRYELFDWLELLSDDVEYLVPVRTTREKTADSFSTDSYHFKDDRSSLQTRVERISMEYDWSEDPPSRVRRFVTNVRVTDAGQEEAKVRSYLLLFQTREERREPDWLSAERIDTIRLRDDGLRLARRVVHLDHTKLGTDRLTTFL